MTAAQFLPKPYKINQKSGSFSWQAPSNIALVKYWGKYGAQLPKNASLSFTLSKCCTITTLSYEARTPIEQFDFKVYLDGKREVGFEPKIQKFFERVETYLPFLKGFTFKIDTSNSFPHSSGIASSASGLSALALCLMSVERSMTGEQMTEEYFIKKASFLARLGSGSACRSLQGDLIVWGEHSKIDGSSNLFAVQYPNVVHANFKNYQDTILLVDKGEKMVSSTVGHNLMVDHPYAEQRFQQANENLTKLIPILAKGQLDKFIEIVENEALSLHAMMLSSSPSFILMKPNTLEIINRIWEFRKATKCHVCFTLDAGANVHVLYPESEKEEVLQFIRQELVPFCKNREYIEDQAGFGAKQQ